MKALLSIHDLRPDTLDDVLALMELLGSHDLRPVYLLVTHGCPWTTDEVGVLRSLADNGNELVSHGWTHRAREIRGIRHRLHSLALSRHAAEHLSLPAEELESMLQRCFYWFRQNGLPDPSIYVPPAWGLGKLTRKSMKRLPFRWYELVSGIYDSESDVLKHVPLVGFEADTPVRKRVLSLLNSVNLAAARSTGRPVRVAIHPRDLSLELSQRLRHLLESPLTPVTINSI